MILPNSSNSNYRKPGTLGTLDYYYRTLNQKLGEYVLPIAGAAFLLLTIFSTYHLPIPSFFFTKADLQYLWIGALSALILTLMIASVKFIKPYTRHRKMWITVSTVLGLFLTIGLFHVFGIVPLSISTITTYINPGQSYLCPSNAYITTGDPGCVSGVTMTPSSGTSSSFIAQGTNFNCPSNADYQCTISFYTQPTATAVTTTFTETGVPSDFIWAITYNGQTQQISGGNSIIFTDAPGTYSFSVSGVYDYSGVLQNNYIASPQSGSLQAGSTQNIIFSEITSTTTSSSDNTSISTSSASLSGSFTLNIVGPVLAPIASFLYIN
jgi:hypothetical protein